MNQRKTITLSLILGIFLTLISPLWFDNSVQAYFEDKNGYSMHHEKYKWEIYGGWYRNIYYHEAWPELGIKAEWKLVPLGIVCSLLMWTFIVFVIIFNIKLYLKILEKKKNHNPEADLI